MMKNAAQSILDEVWGDRGFPVDPVWIARQLGLDVIETALPPDVSGAIVKEKGYAPVILLEATDAKTRKRFSCAHELGHYINRGDVGDEFEYVDYRDGNSSTGSDPEERLANAFAANLLMPEEEVHRLVAQGQRSVIMAYRFGVSDEALRVRLKSLRISLAA